MPFAGLSRKPLATVYRRQLQSYRYFASSSSGNEISGNSPLLWIGCIALGGAVSYYLKAQKAKKEAEHQREGLADVDETADAKTSVQDAETAK
ncbi:uncharacterized protein BYT42DRAFT_642893 [Radiomyces spectabilis]|uniref:uncharacterized protein n=1 Tax=Radiomyces spectabilis TaxID=64574 RepID=UPI00221F14D7|nr:uncharacterized protein BYT42DRAFT_642893 [Radiomyces spectabilis]KAI8388729.1 hypothetical protein BYT42DRAFT_642893 [Radiomyces spectabilis]